MDDISEDYSVNIAEKGQTGITTKKKNRLFFCLNYL